MGDAELDAIRQRRMQQMMQQQYGGQMPQSAEEQREQEERRAAAEEQRRAMVLALLEPGARDRLARIALVKADKARAVEDLIIAAARRGQLGGKVSEARLIELLETVAAAPGGGARPATKVTIQRRRALDDDF